MLTMKLPMETGRDGGEDPARNGALADPDQSRSRLRPPPLDKETVFEWFGLQLDPARRLELMCGLLHMCQPLELRFLGSYLEDLARKDFYVLRDFDSRANSPSDLATLTDAVDPVVRAKLLVCLSLLQSDNRECAGVLFQILSLYPLHPPSPPPGELDQLLLLLTMASLHPAFHFHQREAVRLQLDRIRLLSESPQDLMVPPSPPDPLGEPPPPCGRSKTSQREAAHIEDVVLKNVCRSRTEKEYNFEVKWSNSTSSKVTKTHSDLETFLLKLPKDQSSKTFERNMVKLLNDAENPIREHFLSAPTGLGTSRGVCRFFSSDSSGPDVHRCSCSSLPVCNGDGSSQEEGGASCAEDPSPPHEGAASLDTDPHCRDAVGFSPRHEDQPLSSSHQDPPSLPSSADPGLPEAPPPSLSPLPEEKPPVRPGALPVQRLFVDPERREPLPPFGLPRLAPPLPVSPGVQPVVQRFKTSSAGGRSDASIIRGFPGPPPSSGFCSVVQESAVPHVDPPQSKHVGVALPSAYSQPPAPPSPQHSPEPPPDPSHSECLPSGGPPAYPQQPAGCGACGCLSNGGGVASACHRGPFFSPHQMSTTACQMFGVPPPLFQLTGLCSNSYLPQSTPPPFFPSAPPTYLHPPSPSPTEVQPHLVASYSLQQQLGLAASFCHSVYQQGYPNALGGLLGSGGGVNKNNGNVSCCNCGGSGHYAQDCSQPAIDAKQTGGFQLKYIVSHFSESLENTD